MSCYEDFVFNVVNFMVRGQGNRAGLGWKPDEVTEELITAQQAQIKQGWSLLATLHCVLLPDKVVVKGSKVFKRPQIEMMARRWQHHCLEVCTHSTISNLSSKVCEINKYLFVRYEESAQAFCRVCEWGSYTTTATLVSLSQSRTCVSHSVLYGELSCLK